MTNKLEKWEKLRAKGKWNYILLYGVLGWGFSTGILFSLIFPLGMAATGSSAPFLPVFALSVALFPLGGVALFHVDIPREGLLGNESLITVKV